MAAGASSPLDGAGGASPRTSKLISDRHGPLAMLLAATCYLGCIVALAAPGFASFDTAYQWWMARHAAITTLWPPFYVASFSALERLSGVAAPTAWFVINITAMATASAMIAHACARTSGGGLFALAALLCSPVVWQLIPHVWSDVALTSSLLCAIACLARAALGGTSRHRWLISSLVTLWVATGVRHNAAVAVFPLTVAWMWFALGHLSTTTRRRCVAATVGGVVLILVIVATHSGLARLLAQQRADTWAITAIWDLQALSVASGEVLVPRSISPDTTLDDLRGSFDPVNAVTLYVRSGARWANATTGLNQAQSSDLLSAWYGAVTRQPLAYVRHRLRNLGALLGAPGSAQGTRVEPVQTAFGDNPARTFWSEGGVAIWRRWAVWLASLGAWTQPLATVVIAFTLAFATSVRQRASLRLSISRGSGDRTALALATAMSGTLYLLGLAFTAPTADMRYALWPVVAAVLTAVFTCTTRSFADEAASPLSTSSAR